MAKAKSSVASLDIAFLQDQLAKFEQELLTAQAHAYRLDGAIQIIKQQIEHLKAPATNESEAQ